MKFSEKISQIERWLMITAGDAVIEKAANRSHNEDVLSVEFRVQGDSFTQKIYIYDNGQMFDVNGKDVIDAYRETDPDLHRQIMQFVREYNYGGPKIKAEYQKPIRFNKKHQVSHHRNSRKIS